MIDIQVKLGERSYPVQIGPWRDWDLRGVLGSAGDRPLPLVADRKIWGLWGRDLTACFGSSGFDLQVLELDAGEPAKNLETLCLIYDHLMATRTRRDGTLLVFGGGVLGDLAGFAAATFQRGMSYVQIPSTLLAQVDSSVGGKTGLNYGGHKNMIGAFHQPRAVLVSPEWLATLPDREFRSGLAEIVKCGVIRDLDLLRLLEEEEPDRLPRSPRLEEIIARALVVKSRIVEADEDDRGLRAVLNFGHTIGHALEAVTGFERFLHGEAVAVGMVGALALSVQMLDLSDSDAARVEQLLRRYRLSTAAPGVDPERLWNALDMDKKVSRGGAAWVLTEALGKATVTTQVPPAYVRSVIQRVVQA